MCAYKIIYKIIVHIFSSYKHGFDDDSYEDDEDLNSSEAESYEEDDRMGIMTVSRTHDELCDEYQDTHVQYNSIYPLNPQLSRNVWSERTKYEPRKFDEQSAKKDIGVQGK